MKKTNENKNFQIKKVEDISNIDSSIEHSDKSQKRPPQPLTREQLEYYHKAREQALRRKAKPVSGKKSNENTQSNEAYKRPIKSSNEEKVNGEDSNHSSLQQNLKQNKISKKREQAAKRAEHLRKQAYYDSKYADDTEIVDYYDFSNQDKSPRQSKKFIHGLFRFISWLIFFIIFIIIGYFLAKLILG